MAQEYLCDPQAENHCGSWQSSKHTWRPLCERHSNTMITCQVVISLWWLRKLRFMDAWNSHFQVHPLATSVWSAQLQVTDLPGETRASLSEVSSSCSYEHLCKITESLNLTGFTWGQEEGLKVSQKKLFCAYLGSDKSGGSIQKRLWGYRPERKKVTSEVPQAL